MTSESSVVVALREVRRLEAARQARETAALERQQSEEHQAWEAARARASQQYPVVPEQDEGGYQGGQAYPGYEAQGQGGFGQLGRTSQTWTANPHDPYAHMRRTSELGPLEPQGWTGAARRTTTSAFEVPAPAAPAEPIRTKSAAGPIFMTLVLCTVAAAGGYYKLDQDTRAAAAVKNATLAQVEKERNEAFEARTRTESESKLKLAALDARVKELEGALAAAKAAIPPPAAAPVAQPAVAPAPVAARTPVAVASAPARTTTAVATPSPAKPAARPVAKAAPAKKVVAKAAPKAVRAAPVKRVAIAQPEPESDRPVADKETSAAVRRVNGAKQKAAVNEDPLGGLRL